MWRHRRKIQESRTVGLARLVVGGFAESGTVEDQGAQATQLVAIEVAELSEKLQGPAFQIGLDGLQQLEPLGGDAGYGLALVVTAAAAPHQALGLQAIDEAGDVGGALDHALGDLAAGMALGMDTAQDAQDVVLRAGETVMLADLIDHVIDGTGGDGKAEQSLLLGAGESGLLEAAAEGFGHPDSVIARNELVVTPFAWRGCERRQGRGASWALSIGELAFNR